METTVDGPSRGVREIALRTVEAIAKGDVVLLDSCLAEDVVWQVMGADYMPFDGRYEGKAAVMRDLIGTIAAVLDISTFDIEVRNVVCEADRAVVEWLLSVQTKTGRAYQDVDYCAVFTVRDGLVREIHEYTNTGYAKRVLFDPVEA